MQRRAVDGRVAATDSTAISHDDDVHDRRQAGDAGVLDGDDEEGRGCRRVGVGAAGEQAPARCRWTSRPTSRSESR